MYKCEQCNKVSLLGEKQETKIISRRNRNYFNIVTLDELTKKKKYYSLRDKDLNFIKELENNGLKILKTYWSRGNEIVKEIKICKNCINK